MAWKDEDTNEAGSEAFLPILGKRDGKLALKPYYAFHVIC